MAGVGELAASVTSARRNVVSRSMGAIATSCPSAASETAHRELGSEDLITLANDQALAVLYVDTDRLEEAERLLSDVLAIRAGEKFYRIILVRPVTKTDFARRL